MQEELYQVHHQQEVTQLHLIVLLFIIIIQQVEVVLPFIVEEVILLLIYQENQGLQHLFHLKFMLIMKELQLMKKHHFMLLEQLL